VISGIPQGQVEITTDHGMVFVLGPAGENGERDIRQKSSIFKLDFTRCVVNKLAVGSGLVVTPLNGRCAGVAWDSSPVKNIEEC